MQSDLLNPHLTVRETLYYTASLRLPAATSNKERDARVEEVIQTMGLSLCQNVIVGDPARKGISGGERRRSVLTLSLYSGGGLGTTTHAHASSSCRRSIWCCLAPLARTLPHTPLLISLSCLLLCLLSPPPSLPPSNVECVLEWNCSLDPHYSSSTVREDDHRALLQCPSFPAARPAALTFRCLLLPTLVLFCFLLHMQSPPLVSIVSPPCL